MNRQKIDGARDQLNAAMELLDGLRNDADDPNRLGRASQAALDAAKLIIDLRRETILDNRAESLRGPSRETTK